jgi:hypothetical protein
MIKEQNDPFDSSFIHLHMIDALHQILTHVAAIKAMFRINNLIITVITTCYSYAFLSTNVQGYDALQYIALTS